MDYPNEKALYDSHRKYLDAMREFIYSYLEKMAPGEAEELIGLALNRQPNDNVIAAIDFGDIPRVFHEYWDDFFYQRFGPNRQRNFEGYDIRSVTRLISECRNRGWGHPGVGDLDPEFTRACLFLITDVLEEIGKLDAQREVEHIRAELFSHDTDERIADMTKQLETESIKFKITEAGKTVAEERLSDISNRFEEAEAENVELEKRLKTMSDRLKDVEKENAAYQKRVETIPDQLEVEKTKYEKVLKAASNQLATLKREKAQLEARLETTSTQLEDVKKELADCKERLGKKESLPPNPNPPDSITFQGTTFTRHLKEYHVAGDDISQSFWYYWQSQGREGKQEMRDAGWSVEKVDGEWEVAVSSEDFRAWIEYEVTKLNNLFNSPQNEKPSTQSTRPAYERTSLPTVKEMVQPALEVFADRKEHRRIEMINHLTEHFSLDDDERRYISKTGQVEKHLMNEGLIERTRTGYYRITARGYKVVEIPF